MINELNDALEEDEKSNDTKNLTKSEGRTCSGAWRSRFKLTKENLKTMLRLRIILQNKS